jgi:hypothetical protein
MTDSERQLVDLYLDGVLPESEHALLFQRLETDHEALTYLASRTQLHVDLRRCFKRRKLQQMAVADAATTMARQTRFPWLSWRPLTAAAAGIVFGMFCTSVAFAYVAPSLGKVITLLQEGFESGPAPLVTGVPPEPNVWSGDYSEIVLESEGVKPEDGWKMARLLRSDYEGRTEQGRSQQGDLMRVIDVRSYLGQSKSADVVMTLSAHFNAVPFPAAEHYQGLVMIYALDADKELPGRTEWDIEKNALAQCIGKCDVDRDPATWQAASTRLLLPAGTAFVMLKASMARKPGESEKLSSLPKSAVFAGHFVDGVDASILIRDAVPDHRTQASTHVAQ